MVRLGTKCPSCVRSGLLFFFYVGAYPQLLYVRPAHDTRGYPARNCSSVNTTEKISWTTEYTQGVVNRAVFSQRNFREGNPIHRLWLRHQTPEALLTQAEGLCKRRNSRSDISYQTYQQKAVIYYEQQQLLPGAGDFTLEMLSAIFFRTMISTCSQSAPLSRTI